MSQSNFHLSLAAADDLACRIAAEFAPVCERIEVAGSVRRLRPTAGDLELVVIPKFSPSLVAGVPGPSLLEMALLAAVQQGRLIQAAKNEGQRLKRFFIGSLKRQGKDFKLEINISDAERWPVELAIKTGSAEFSKMLVTYRKYGGFLPAHWKICDGWQVWQGDTRLRFESERDFIEQMCGAWVPPEKRG